MVILRIPYEHFAMAKGAVLGLYLENVEKCGEALHKDDTNHENYTGLRNV